MIFVAEGYFQALALYPPKSHQNSIADKGFEMQ
jgi:hypothetical protein